MAVLLALNKICAMCICVIKERERENEKIAADNVACTNTIRNAWRVLERKADSGDHLEDTNIRVRMILK